MEFRRNSLRKAKGKLDDKKVKMDKLLNELQKEKNYLTRLNKEHIEAQDIASKAFNEYEEKRELYEAKLKGFRDNAESNQKLIQNGKKLAQFIDRYNINTRKKSINDGLMEEIRKYVAVEKSKIEEAKRKEKLQKKPTVRKKSKRKQVQKDNFQRDKIKMGSRVKLISTKQIGTVEEMKDKSVTVSFGFARMKVDLEKLMWVQD